MTADRAARVQVWLTPEVADLADQVCILVGQLEGRRTPPRTEVVAEALRRYHVSLSREQTRAQNRSERGAAWRPPSGEDNP